MIRLADIDTPFFYLVYDMWDTMIEEVRKLFLKKMGKIQNMVNLNFIMTLNIFWK